MKIGQPYPGNVDRSIELRTVTVERLLHATRERIWQVIGTAQGMQNWMSMHNFEPRLDGRMLIDTSGASIADRLIVYGRVLEIKEQSLLRMSWRLFREDGTHWPDFTEVALLLEQQDGGTLVQLVHSGFEKLGALSENAWSVYHHCWVQAPYLARLEEQDGARA